MWQYNSIQIYGYNLLDFTIQLNECPLFGLVVMLIFTSFPSFFLFFLVFFFSIMLLLLIGRNINLTQAIA